MPVRYNERLGTWEFDTVKEAKAFKDEMAGLAPRQPFPGAKGAHGPAPKDTVRKTLVLLANAGDKGLLGEQIAPVVGLKSARGMAGLAHSVEQYLYRAIGESAAKRAFRKEKKPGRPARWFGDPNVLRGLKLDGAT